MGSVQVRVNVVASDRTASFLMPVHALKMCAAACVSNPETLDAFFTALGQYDPALADDLSSALRDPGDAPWESRAFPVESAEDRVASQHAAPGGMVIVNLTGKRIIQVQNAVAEIEREGRGRLRRNGRPVQVYYRYLLPEAWSLVP